MNFKGLYDVSYRVKDNLPTIVLSLRTPEGKKEFKFINKFRPYFYIKKQTLLKYKAPMISDVDFQEYKSIYGDVVKKCFMRRPSDIWTIRKFYEEKGIDPYKELFESDLAFDLRYAVDEVENNEKTNYKIMTFDIETDCLNGFPKKENPVEPIICVAVHDNYSNKMNSYAWREDIEPHVESYANGNVFYYNNETDMLQDFIEYWNSVDADIVSGWNLAFDTGYLVARLQRLNLDIGLLSTLNEAEFNIIRDADGLKTNSPVRIRKKGELEILGVVLFDGFTAYKKMHFGELSSYSLNSIAADELGEEKDKVHNTGEVWRKDIKELIDYNRKDVDLTVRINIKCKLISIFEDIKNFAGVRNLNDCFAASRIHETRIMKKYRHLVFPNKPAFQEKSEETMIKGAFVRESVPGLYSNVVVFDAKSLYPSIIYTFNLSKEMISQTEGSLINGIRIKQQPKGIMPSMIKDLVSLKDRMKKEVEGTGQDVADKMFAIKTFINSFYGINALTNFRLYEKQIAENITYLGRQIVTKLGTEIETKYNYKCIYGDTDSLFIEIPSSIADENENREYVVARGKEVQNYINGLLPNIISELGGDASDSTMFIEFEKVFKKILFMGKSGSKSDDGAKKRYAGHIIWLDDKIVDKIKLVGVASRRSDVSDLSRKMQAEVFDLVLKGKPSNDVVLLLRNLMNEMKTNKLSLNDCALPVKLNKAMEEYKGGSANGPRMRGIRWSNEHLNTRLAEGMKFKMLYVKHPETDVVCFEDEEQVKGIEIDWPVMFNKCIFQKIQTIFSAMSWDGEYEELLEDYSPRKRRSRFKDFDDKLKQMKLF